MLERMHRIRPYALESLLAMYYCGMAVASGLQRSWIMVGYCGLMTVVFLAMSFGDLFM